MYNYNFSNNKKMYISRKAKKKIFKTTIAFIYQLPISV